MDEPEHECQHFRLRGLAHALGPSSHLRVHSLRHRVVAAVLPRPGCLQGDTSQPPLPCTTCQLSLVVLLLRWQRLQPWHQLLVLQLWGQQGQCQGQGRWQRQGR